MSNREAGKFRLTPSIFNSRYYYLKQLTKAIVLAFKNELKNRNQLILVDYGCGNTPYKPVFEPFLQKYIGVDLAENKNADVHISPNGTINLPDNYSDIVLSTQVLEHVEDVKHYLSEAYRVLKPGGTLILSTHGYWVFHPDPTDFWRWTSTGLKKIVTENQFEITSFTGIIGRSAMGLMLFQDGLMFKLPKIARPLVSIFIQPFIAIFDKIHKQKDKNKDACTFIVVAKKK